MFEECRPEEFLTLGVHTCGDGFEVFDGGEDSELLRDSENRCRFFFRLACILLTIPPPLGYVPCTKTKASPRSAINPST